MPLPFGIAGSGFDSGCGGILDDNAADNVFFKSYIATLAAAGSPFTVTMLNGTSHSAENVEAIGDATVQVATLTGYELWFLSDIRTIASETQPPVVICDSCCGH